MIICQLCAREFKNEQGLSIHMARVHAVHGDHGRLSVKTIHKFFPSLKKRRWTEAERFLKVVEKDMQDTWRKGYAHALRGMIVVLRTDHSPTQPYILQLERYDKRMLQEAKQEFRQLYKNPLNKGFDKGYFKAWVDYIQCLLFHLR